MNNTECIICFENIDDNKYSLECNHNYHIDCIMKWFRNGNNNCPMCNDTKWDSVNYGIKIQSIKEVKKLIKLKNCPKNIKSKIQNIKKKEIKFVEHKKQFKQFKKDNKKIIDKYFKMSRQIWKNRSKIRDAENNLLAIVTLNPIIIKK